MISKHKSIGFKHCNDPKAFIEYFHDLDDVYEIIDEYNLNKKRIILMLFDDMIADMLSKRKPNPAILELFLIGRKVKISLVFITKCYFAISKNIRLNCVYYFILKILNKK